jgi:hypothetical protein
LNYKKTSRYSFDYDSGTQYTSITNQKNGKYISISFGKNTCGFYGLIGPLVFPIFPIWENDDCKDVVLGVSPAKKVQIIYHDKIYEPSKVVRDEGYFFSLPIKSITDTAILVVEKKMEKPSKFLLNINTLLALLYFQEDNKPNSFSAICV